MSAADPEAGGPPHGGRVLLVGAGPGSVDLLTLRGADALRTADVVLYDELVAEELLELVSPGAECVNVGRRGHELPTRSQSEINALLVERARGGATVVRLKGGDPFVFGRGGEEATACAEARIPFEIVPGVSSAIAAPSYAGIPVTDRRYSASFAVVTGHHDPTRVAQETRWGDLGRAVDTLVILMGMRNLPELVQKMLDGGKPPDTPAAAVMFGTLPTQRVLEAPLAGLPDAVREARLGAPAAIVVGDVVRLRESLAWYERLPLFGWRVVVTRPADQAGEMVDALRRSGAEPVLAPMIRLAPPGDCEDLDRALAELDAYDAIVFSSANAVRFFAARARVRGCDLARVTARVVCVGPKTARAALDANLPLQLVPAAGAGGEKLLAELVASLPPRGLRFLLPRSEIGRDELRRGLERAGARVDAVTAYRSERPEVDSVALAHALGDGSKTALAFASPSAVRHFASLLDRESRDAARRCVVVAIGETTAEALESAGLPPDLIAPRPSGRALVEALADRVRAQTAAHETGRARREDEA